MRILGLTPSKAALLGSLYFAQGLPFGFFYQALPVLMRERDYDLVLIGLSSLLAAPWGLKFLWAPMIDRYGHPGFGRRRSFIVPLQLASVLLLAVIAAYGTDRDLNALLIFVFVVNLMAATQDIATDGLALDVLEPEERGPANGLQVAGFRVGMIVGGGALLMLVGSLGWSATFTTMAVLMLVATIPVVLHREAPQPPMEESSWLSIATALVQRTGSFRWLTVVGTYKIGHHMAQSMLRPYMVDQGVPASEIGLALGVVGATAGLFGAVAGGASVRSLGRPRALLIFGIAQAVALLGYGACVSLEASVALVTLVSAVEHFISGMATVALFTVMMDYCRPDSAATDYTLQASLVVVATAAANVLGGVSATYFGYGPHFAVAAVVSGIAAVHAGRSALSAARAS